MNFRTGTTRIVIAGVAVAATVIVVALLLSGGGDEGVDQSDAERADAPGTNTEAIALFGDNCGQCHALTVAGTSADVGPDLDDERYDEARVRQAIEQGPGLMSAGILEGADADAVAKLIGSDEPLLAPTPDN